MRPAELFSSPPLPTTASPSSAPTLQTQIFHSLHKNLSFHNKDHTNLAIYKKKAIQAIHDQSSGYQQQRPRRGHQYHQLPEPPWLVLPPPPPQNPFSGQQAPLPEVQMKAVCSTGIPFSLRLVQMKKRLSLTAPPISPDLLGEGPVPRAVAALLFMIWELQKPVFEEDVDDWAFDRVSRDRRDSFVWLFRRVFANSPNLVPLVLLLLAGFIASSTEKAFTAAAAAANDLADASAESTQEGEGDTGELAVAGIAATDVGDETGNLESFFGPPVIGNFISWFDIGIKEGILDYRKAEEETCEDRRRRAYERAIAQGEVNSLILSNYAQFLYRVAHDHDRAEQYFKWATMAEPKDAVAMSRYAMFLWEERGDVSRAEEMFLEAIDTDPESFYQSSNYAWFLWKTGAEDTCFPLSPPLLPPPPSQ